MSYATEGQLCSYLGIPTPSEAVKVQLGGFLLTAQAIIDRQTGRTFEATADTTRYLDACRDVDGAMLLLKHDLCRITTITNGDGVVVTAGQYVTEPRDYTPYYALRLRRNSGLAWTYTGDGEDAIAIEGRWAYSVSAPADIQQATLRLAAWLYRQKDNATDLDRPLMTFDGHVVMPMALPNDVRSLVKPYVRAIIMGNTSYAGGGIWGGVAAASNAIDPNAFLDEDSNALLDENSAFLLDG